jgi:hypothetical protein
MHSAKSLFADLAIDARTMGHHIATSERFGQHGGVREISRHKFSTRRCDSSFTRAFFTRN